MTAVLRGNCNIYVNTYNKKQGRSQINNLAFYHKEYNRKKRKLKASRRKEIKFIADINEVDNIKNNEVNQWNQKLALELWKKDQQNC